MLRRSPLLCREMTVALGTFPHCRAFLEHIEAA
jgi:hypothetical protein